MTPAREYWFEDDAGRVVRPYAVAAGRDREARHDLDMITLVKTVRSDIRVSRMEAEHVEIVHLCAQPLSVAEVSARLRLPLFVTKVLICDLIEAGYLTYRASAPADTPHDPVLLQALLNGIRSL
ncbi:DUF742 domain-containing protein [Nocardia asteroides]|uniref:DUF742 domain-containing protein n=1 Tax=Nocardia asteroides TaxID=1824 RepID=UPI001E4B5586|nr:DUF742 domain-containing protein [Nocardia asteroides]UGT61850.1 DUF742 domain-containing protein [Nocardia asteroides]